MTPNREWAPREALFVKLLWPLVICRNRRRRRFWHATLRLRSTIRRHHPPQRAVLAKSAASGSVRWWCFRSCWMVLSHVMRGRPGCLLQSARGEANRILLASALSSMCIICPNRVSRRDWIIAVSRNGHVKILRLIEVFWIFSQQLRIFMQSFILHAYCVFISTANYKKFIQLPVSLNLIKLCHINHNHPANFHLSQRI